MLILGAAAVLGLVLGLGYAVVITVRSAAGPAESSSPRGQEIARGVHVDQVGHARGRAHRDAIAAAPMMKTSGDDAQPSAPSTHLAGMFEVPQATRQGPQAVPTGFPRTPAGAVGQLAQIDATVLQAMSLRTADGVYRAWALPGGPGASRWEITGSVRAFLAATGQTAEKDATTTVVVEPAGALVKGTDGADWTLACVQFRVRATVSDQAQVGYGHCSRMQWSQGRWMIGPGSQPARAPSAWPGTEVSREAGWLSWEPAS